MATYKTLKRENVGTILTKTVVKFNMVYICCYS